MFALKISGKRKKLGPIFIFYNRVSDGHIKKSLNNIKINLRIFHLSLINKI